MLSSIWHWVGWDGVLAATIWGSIVASLVSAHPCPMLAQADHQIAMRILDWAIAITMPLVVIVLTGLIAVIVYLYQGLARMARDHADLSERVATLEARQLSRHDFANLQHAVATAAAVQGEMLKRVERFEDKLDRILEEGH